MAANLDKDEILLQRMKPKEYLPICKKAIDRLAYLSDDSELIKALFSDEEITWLKKQYKSRISH